MSGYSRPVFTVVTPTTDHDMTDLPTVKAELNITTTDATRDSVLSRYITASSKAAEQFCNRVFVVEVVQDQFFPPRDRGWGVLDVGFDPLQLTRWPVVSGSISSVTENGVALVEGTDFEADYNLGQLIRLGIDGYPRQWKRLPTVINYPAGYNPIPVDVSEAIIRMVSQRYFARGRDPNLRNETVPGVYQASYWVTGAPSEGQDGNLSPDVQALLDNYRVPVVQ